MSALRHVNGTISNEHSKFLHLPEEIILFILLAYVRTPVPNEEHFKALGGLDYYRLPVLELTKLLTITQMSVCLFLLFRITSHDRLR